MKLEPRPQLPRDLEGLHRRLTELVQRLHEQVNGITEGKASARHTAVSSMPTTGVYAKGDYVPNADPAKLGMIGFHYVIAGWIRLTGGDSHVLNTDWVQDRRLTGD